MPKKLAGLVTNNFGLKILGVIFAVILWLAIVNTADPDKSTTFSVPVQVVNADYLTDAGKTYEITNNTETISFTVTGKRSIVENLTPDDFRATANIENIDDSMSMVPITLTATRYSSQLDISVRDTYLTLSVEDLVTKQFEITAVTNGDPAGGCYVESVEISPETVSVTGPESVVNQIDSAMVYIDTGDADDSLLSNETLTLVDGNGSEISQERLSLDSTVVVAMTTIWMEKTVPISFEVSGDPAEGYLYTGVSCNVDSVTVHGSPDVIGSLDELVISSSQLNIEGADRNVTAQVYLQAMLPTGARLGDDDPITVEVVMEIEQIVSREFDMPVRNLSVTGPDEGLSYSVNAANDVIAVTVDGLAEDLDAINANRISGSVDLSGLDVGTYTLPLTLNGDYGTSAGAQVSVTIRRSN